MQGEGFRRLDFYNQQKLRSLLPALWKAMVYWSVQRALRDDSRVREICAGGMSNKPKTKPLRYFFYRGDLHKKIHINRGDDVITAWNYPKAQVFQYVYSDVRKNGEQAFSTRQVEKLVRRTRRTIAEAISGGWIRPPQRTYGMDANRNGYAYYWSEKDIMELHDYLKTVHRGRPRKDGRITPQDLPTASELRAMIRQGTVFYVKVGDEFVPTWQAEKF